jgi:hypothetical protein
VVGVVRDVRHQALEERAGSEFYAPFAQLPDHGTLVMVVRSPLPATTLAPSVRGVLRAADATMPIDRTR